MAVEHAEQLHQRDRRLDLARLIARKRIDATAEDLASLVLSQTQFFAHALDGERIDCPGIQLAREIAHEEAVSGGGKMVLLPAYFMILAALAQAISRAFSAPMNRIIRGT